MTVRRRQIGAVMLLPTLVEVLELPAVRRGEPAVRAGTAHLDRPVRWVHVSEVSDIAHLLEGGELILTTGIALPESPALLPPPAPAPGGPAGPPAPRAAAPPAGGPGPLAADGARRYRSALPPELVEA